MVTRHTSHKMDVTRAVCHLAIGSIYFVENVGENDKSIHFMEGILGQNFLPKWIFSKPDIVPSKRSVHTGNMMIMFLLNFSISFIGQLLTECTHKVQQNIKMLGNKWCPSFHPCILSQYNKEFLPSWIWWFSVFEDQTRRYFLSHPISSRLVKTRPESSTLKSWENECLHFHEWN